MGNPLKKISLSTRNFIHLIKVENILYCQSNNSYTTFFFNDNKETITVSVSIKKIEEQLCNNNFIRPHQSYLVNTLYIKSLSKISDGELLLANGTYIPVSSRKKKAILHFLKQSSQIQ
ncbi:LytR/AlgR family response regulator transcription factor [Carboxylicivirga sp. N1Y90]|uniref:LytR/AlgR family response regulator transcription factor n=1 Tax=Carboxylicivirga fragile TaxID=3417571 RepID=UPI003D34745D|nr:LytTR family transcriptional regulator [Marinilabiliaceae bacterium N1Y90]